MSMYLNGGTIPHEVPDVEVMLKMPPEEFAGVVLRVVAWIGKEIGRNTIHPSMLREKLRPSEYQWPGYKSLLGEAEEAFDEAWAWLVAQGLLVEPVEVGSNGYVRISRRGKTLLTETAFRTYSAGVNFHQSFLHPTIGEACWLDLVRGDAEIAVFRAFKAVEVEIRKRAGYDKKKYGQPMVAEAFHAHIGPLRDKANPVEPERLAELALFSGAMGLIKNPASHRAPTVEEMQLAKEQVVFASMLLRILDGRPMP